MPERVVRMPSVLLRLQRVIIRSENQHLPGGKHYKCYSPIFAMQELRNNSVSLSHLHSWPCCRPDSFARYETELGCLVAAAQGGFCARITFFKSCFGQETLCSPCAGQHRTSLYLVVYSGMLIFPWLIAVHVPFLYGNGCASRSQSPTSSQEETGCW